MHDLEEFLKNHDDKDLWVVGGAAVFSQVIEAGYADELYVTRIEADFGCDQFFPAYEKDFKLVSQSETHVQNGFTFSYALYTKISD